jgi:hypothetical protein
VIARAIHYNSDRSTAPFLAVNCGAIPDQLLESELFGHTKGAFTGAATNRAGFFQAADGGTFSWTRSATRLRRCKAKLLRAVQEKEVTMLGGTKPQRVNVRLISASNSDLNEMVRTGTFREDLYYRLNLINIHCRRLRDRTEDIPLLINHFNAKFSKDMGKKPLRIPARVMDAAGLPLAGQCARTGEFHPSVGDHEGYAVAMEDLPSTHENGRSGTTRLMSNAHACRSGKTAHPAGAGKRRAEQDQGGRDLGDRSKTLREKLK